MADSSTTPRRATIERATGETRIAVTIDLDGGEVTVDTGVGFLDHMLDLLGHHGRIGLQVEAAGDLETGSHHTVEDVGIALGQAIDAALGDRSGIARYAHVELPMDESLAVCTIDVSGRPFLRFRSDLPPVSIGGFEVELTEEFFRAVTTNAKLTLHLENPYGSNAHHMIEACFKAFARALRDAVAIDPGESGVPSTKGTLTT